MKLTYKIPLSYAVIVALPFVAMTYAFFSFLSLNEQFGIMRQQNPLVVAVLELRKVAAQEKTLATKATRIDTAKAYSAMESQLKDEEQTFRKNIKLVMENSALTAAMRKASAGLAPLRAAHSRQVAALMAPAQKRIALRDRMGRSASKGLRGKFRKAAHALEAAFKRVDFSAFKMADIMVDYLMLRRHEKDYIIRELPKYLKKNAKVLSKMEKRIKGATALKGPGVIPMKGALATSLLKEISTYRKNFANLVHAIEERSALRKKTAQTLAAFEKAQGSLFKTITAGFTMVQKHSLEIANNSETTLNKNKSFFLGAMVISFFVALALAFFMAQGIRRPMKKLLDSASALANGDLSHEVKVSSKDELGTLGGALNETIVSLREMMDRIQKESHTLSSKSEEYSNLASSLSMRAGEMAANSEQVSSRTDNMDMDISEVATLSSVMAQSSTNALSNAQVVLTQMDNVSDVASKSREQLSTLSAATEEMTLTISEISHSVQNTMSVTTEAVTTVEDTSKVMDDLHAASKEIEKVIDVIKDIADQTQLLALNATIEAASAGEAGRGFSIVAQEVKTLANQSETSAEVIMEKVNFIQQSVDRAIISVNSISETVHQSSNYVTTIASAIEEQNATTLENANAITSMNMEVEHLADNVIGAKNAVNSIVSNMTQLDGHTGEVNTYMGNVSQAASEVRTSTGALAQEIQQVTSASETLLSDAEELRRISTTLSDMTARFTLA